MSSTPAAPASITHHHIFAVLNSLIKEQPKDEINILDAGCGSGVMLEYLQTMLMVENPKTTINIYGFDVSDHGVQSTGFLSKTIEMLGQKIPEIDWKTRIRGIRIGEPWPFDPASIDYVVSNQVMEHVHDKPAFFQNVHKTLKNDGYFIALNPLKHCIYEGHIFLLWAHRIRSHPSLMKYIRLCSLLGMGKFPQHRRDLGATLENYCERHADYIHFWTSYASEAQTLDMAKNAGLRASFSFTKHFYFQKLRMITGRKFLNSYPIFGSNLSDSMWIKFFRYVSSVTLLCQKRNIY